MFRSVLLSIVFLWPLMQFGQDFSALWKGHFSYNTIKDVVEGHDKIYAASDNAIFSYDLKTHAIEELNTINGLSGESISTIYYSEPFQLLLIGYESGLIEMVFDHDSAVLTIVDIIDKTNISPTNKRINHFNAFGNVVYIATNYGISVYNMERLEFVDTYLIGNNGDEIKVNQTAIIGEYIYAACSNGNGIRKALVSSSALADFQNWQTIVSGSFIGVQNIENNLFGLRTDRTMFKIINDVLNPLFQYNVLPKAITSNGTNLIVTTANNVFVYDSAFNMVSQIDVSDAFLTSYTAAAIGGDHIYVGTSKFGLLKTALSSPILFEELHPEGPLLNVPFSLKAGANDLWVTFGEYNLFFNSYPLNNRGISHLKGTTWINTPYSEVFNAKNLNAISVNPFNNDHVFISSFYSGLLEVKQDVPSILYNQDNSGLESLVLPTDPNYIDVRVGASAFDENGVLWSMTSLIDKPLKSFNLSNNQWKSYDFTDVIPKEYGSNLGFSDLVIGRDGTKWTGSYKYGVIGFKENGANPLLKNIKKEEENMPTEYVTALALDKRDQLWIGTFKGLRVLYNTANFFTDNNAKVDEIIILEDGIAKELLFQQFISDIEVDGSNNKWVATIGTGLFYLSSDGQKTIYHFTTKNSPLPSNDIVDVSIDNNNGTVYIATSKGLVSFRSGSSGTAEDLERAFVYPNPVRPHFNIVEDKVKIKEVSENVNIKITDIEGNLVAEAQSKINLRHRGYNLEIDGGTAYWNGKNLANHVVASGVYLVMLSNLDTFETKVLKLMVVR
ncbi:two-component regulator propeller domain-containing protein [Mariniflexile ostreae]|uniref:Two-component regulator propeller domain-containing protein n=1 Tax=Mariniflexile ostreae TaxID=1520892 RepID=A0ABV5F7U9_9FLAO